MSRKINLDCHKYFEEEQDNGDGGRELCMGWPEQTSMIQACSDLGEEHSRQKK
jgi:hypothetical protein